jgi:hypothetical protein
MYEQPSAGYLIGVESVEETEKILSLRKRHCPKAGSMVAQVMTPSVIKSKFKKKL